jgi:hypothetical protein
MKSKFLLLLPIFSLVYAIEALYFSVNFKYTVPISSFLENEISETETNPEINFQSGLFHKQKQVEEAIFYLTENDIPSDGKLEKTLDKLQRYLLTIKIITYLILFFLVISISTFVSLLQNSWYSVFLGRFLFFITGIMSFQYFTISISHIVYVPKYGYYSLIYNLFVLLMMIIGFRILGKSNEYENMKYKSLLIASLNNEDSNSGKLFIKKPNTNLESPNKLINWLINLTLIKYTIKIVTNPIAWHFFIIIFTGIIIGNILYVPLFSLQKSYSSEFGILLFIMLVILSLLYIKNYYFFLKEENIKPLEGFIASFIFLQYRFIRNILYFLFSSLGVIFFVVTLFLLLSLNTILLRNMDLIEKSLNL